MYSAHFRQLVNELSGVDAAELERIASGGGWRKRLIDLGRRKHNSWAGISEIFGRVLGRILWALPAFGEKFRYALVAQDILDNKDTEW